MSISSLLGGIVNEPAIVKALVEEISRLSIVVNATVGSIPIQATITFDLAAKREAR